MRRRGRPVLLGLLVLAGLAGGVAYFFREELGDEWALRKFRRAAASGDPALPQHQEQLLKRLSKEEKLDLAVRLAEDPDPKVRAASVDVLLANQPRAKKQDAVAGLHATSRVSSWRTRVREVVARLLADGDETVRGKALRAVSELEDTDAFNSELRAVLKSGSTADRVIVAGSLAQWNGHELREVIADAGQSDEVRIAAMQSLETYGDRNVAGWRGELRDALAPALRSANPNLRRAALVAARHASGAANVWLDLLCDDQQKEYHSFVLTMWIDALGNDSSRERHWPDSHTAWRQSAAKPHRCAVAGYVLCEGAKRQIQHLEKTPPVAEMAALRDRGGPTGRAFEVQLTRLGNILSVLSAVRWYCVEVEKAPDFAGWLPHETPAGAPPTRNPKAFLFQQAKPIWEACLAHREGYPTRFLGAESIVEYYARRTGTGPPAVRPLGAVMDELLLDQSEFDKLRTRFEGK
jgi:hypothetical protein